MVIRAVGSDDEARRGARETAKGQAEQSAEELAPSPDRKEKPPPQIEIDPSVPNVARGYDYLLGGDHHFEVDRKMMDEMSEVYEGGVAATKVHVKANRAFLGRIVEFLVVEAGIRQFLDIGTGIPNADNVHGAAQKADPSCKVVYVDNDPVVLAYSHRLLRSTSQGATKFLYEDFLDPDKVLEQAGEVLDLSEPVALMAVSLLHSIADHHEPRSVLARYLEALPSGSHLAVSHFCSEIQPEAAEAIRMLNEQLPHAVTDRSRDDILRFFDGTELVEPGLVPIEDWRQTGERFVVPGGSVPPWYGAIGRKP